MALGTLEKLILGGAAIPSVISLFGGSSGGRTPQSTSLAVGDEQASRGISLDAFRLSGCRHGFWSARRGGKAHAGITWPEMN
ncbi:MAG: hypothetical protein V3U53_00230 [bacterium]